MKGLKVSILKLDSTTVRGMYERSKDSILKLDSTTVRRVYGVYRG